MAKCEAKIAWKRHGQRFTDHKYSRAHRWFFDGGVEVPASSSPSIVREPFSDPKAVDPEEAFVASISSCHMLFFLDHASRNGFTVDSYEDDANGILAKNGGGETVVTVVTLKPRIDFTGAKLPTRDDIKSIHHRAHENCFIASSIKTQIVIEPNWQDA